MNTEVDKQLYDTCNKLLDNLGSNLIEMSNKLTLIRNSETRMTAAVMLAAKIEDMARNMLGI